MAHGGIITVGAIMTIIGFLIMIAQLGTPMFFAYQGLILGAVFFGLGIVVMAIGGIAGRSEKKSIYFCGHCKFAASTQADLYNHSVKEHDDDLGFGDNRPSEQVPHKLQPERNLRKSPILKGTIIGVILFSIYAGAIGAYSYHSYVMSNDAMEPTISKYDLIRYDETPFQEIEEGDIIVYTDLGDTSKVWVHRVLEKSFNPLTLKTSSAVSPTRHSVLEDQYIGKVVSIVSGGGQITQVLVPPSGIIIMIAVFIIPIVVMKLRERKLVKNVN